MRDDLPYKFIEMTEAIFRAQRRQKFLTENYYQLNVKFLALREAASWQGVQNMHARGSHDPSPYDGLFQRKLERVKLEYTAGHSVADVIPSYSLLIDALRDWNCAYRHHIKALADESGDDLREDGTGLYFENLGYYQLALDTASLGVLLGQGQLVRELARHMERYRGTDLLFESLIAPAVTDPRDNTDFFHVEPYDPLIDAFYTAETPEQAEAYMKSYLDRWYQAFEDEPWHNGHLHAVEGEYMPYYGYWAFEAAAVCVIHGIDDTSFRDHLVYPKDLADWARTHRVMDQIGPHAGSAAALAGAGLSCQSGQACPRSGWWFTPAQASSRRRFDAGEVMPSLGGDYGATLWQWDEQQAD